MKKLLYIAPHLSTGGLPQYLTKKVELLKDEFEIHLVEWVNHTGGVLVVQRNKLLNLIDSDKFYTLDEDKTELLSIISRVNPDIIHLEEIPEYFMDFEVASHIYNTERDYTIVETSHDSSFDTTQKKFFPDKFMFVSDWQIQQYKDIDIPKVLVEYPIEYIERPNRIKALEKLGLDPSKKHVLHIGLFTPRKNQAEFFEYAKSLPEYEFHCVGNQASNFKYYWEPLMDNKPDNVTWWNERTDVENFYQSMDLFLFTSRGTNNDKETMPLVIREALSYQIPILIYNLPVYLDYFDKFNNVKYLNFNSFDSNVKKIKQHFNTIQNQEAFIISTYPSTDSIINTTLDCVKAVQKHGYKVILTSHIPIPDVLQQQADYCVVDKNNILTKHTFYSNFYWNSNQYDVNLNLKGENNDIYHGPAVYTNYINGAALASQLGFNKVHFLNYDYILKDVDGIKDISSILDKNDFYFGKHHPIEGDALYTYFFSANPKSFFYHLDLISTGAEYNQLMEIYGAESNGLENLFHHIFKNVDSIYREEENIFEEKSKHMFTHEDFSQVEYFTILPTNIPNHFAPYFYISNNKDSRTIYYRVYKNNELIIDRTLNVNQKLSFWDLLRFDGNYKVEFEIKTNLTSEIKTFKINRRYFNNLSQNGMFTWKDEMPKSKIKLLHLVTEPETNEKEKRSIENLKSFCNHTGITYDMRVNKIWKELPPAETCHRPQHIDWKPASIGNGFGKLTPGHYGCYLAHRNAICLEDNTKYDFILIFEGDTIIDSDFDELYNSLFRFNRIAIDQDLDLVGFGNPPEATIIKGSKIEDVYCSPVHFVPAQSYLIPNQSLLNWKHKLETRNWEAWDLWVMNIGLMKSGIADKVYTKHLPGFSLVDQVEKNKNNDNPLIFVD